jgi:hypothetical protein
MVTSLNRAAVTTDSLQASFTALLPRIETHARIRFRDIRCAVRQADCIAEAVALAWKWFCRLMQRGKDARLFVGALASLAARAVRCGRKVCRQESTHDVMNLLAQRRHNFKMEPLYLTRSGNDNPYSSPDGQARQDSYEECLHHNTVTAIPDQAAFRIDFPRWLRRQRRRERRIIRDMMHGERTKVLASKYRLSCGRISQLRRELYDSWQKFHGE